MVDAPVISQAAIFNSTGPEYASGMKNWSMALPIAVICSLIPSCRHKGNSGFMIASPVGAVREPPLHFGLILV